MKDRINFLSAMNATGVNFQSSGNSTQIYILCRDRLDFAREAIRSAVEQDVSNVEVVVSDNSDQDAVADMITAEFSKVTYIRRCPTLGSLEHFRTVMDESSAEYVVFFHDDDIFNPDYVRTMRSALQANPNVVAVGCNAKILRGTKLTDSIYMTTFTHDVFLKQAEELLESYLCFNKYRAAPFPGYMYRRSAIEGLYLDAQDAGKHADVTFLMKLIERGQFLWLAKPLMHYRMHESNDSVIENIGQRLRLLRYIYRNTTISPKSKAVQEFRFRYWLRWWRLEKKRENLIVNRWRKKIVFSYLWRKGICFLLTKSGLWIKIISGAR